MSLFDSTTDLMGNRTVNKYEDPKFRFNQFFALVTSQIDETVFMPLFKDGNIHRTFLQEIDRYMPRLNPSLKRKVHPRLEENAKETVYKSTTETVQQRLGKLGRIIYAILVRVKANYGLLKRVFEEQYVVEHGLWALAR